MISSAYSHAASSSIKSGRLTRAQELFKNGDCLSLPLALPRKCQLLRQCNLSIGSLACAGTKRTRQSTATCLQGALYRSRALAAI